MSKSGLTIDREDLSLYYSTKGKKNKRLLIIGGTGISLLLSLVFAFLFFRNFNSPNEQRLLNEIEKYRTKYNIINAQLMTLNKHVEYFEHKDNYTYRVIYELPALDEEDRLAGRGGLDSNSIRGYSDLTLVSANSLEKMDQIIHRMQVQQNSFEELMQAALSKEKMLASLPTIMPVSKDRVRLSSLFGWRRNPFNRRVFSFHNGVDFSGRIGTPIYATGDGVVIDPRQGMSGYGRFVLINHGFNYKTLYAHLHRALVKPGDRVKRGQVIGYLGNTGSSTGPHLHYEVIKAGNPVNPMNYIFTSLSREEFNKIIEQAELEN